MSEDNKPARVICFANNKGGVGKSSTVATLGRIWASQGKYVLLIDLDSQANLTALFDMKIPAGSKETIHQALIEPGSTWPWPVNRQDKHIDIWPSSLALSNIDLDLAGADSREFRLLDAFQSLIFNYDYILIDCPPALGLMTYNALVAANYLVMVSTPDDLSYSGMGMVAGLASRIRQTPRMNPGLRVLGVVITRYKPGKLSNKYIDLIQNDVDDLLVKPFVRERADFQRSISMHRNIFEYAPESDTAKDYLAVASELEKRILSIEKRSKK